MPESSTSKEVRRLTGQNIESIAQRTLREFAQTRLTAVAEQRSQQAFIPTPVKPPQQMVLPVRPAPVGPVVAPAPNNGDPGKVASGASDILDDVIVFSNGAFYSVILELDGAPVPYP